jgi:hypothetical protein
LLIQPIAIRPAVRHVVPGDRGVEVLAVIHPAAGLHDRERRLVREEEVVGQDVPQAAGVAVDELDLRVLADQVADVPVARVERLAVRAGDGPHDLAVDQEVDRRLDRARECGLVGEHELVGVHVPPPAGALIGDLDPGRPALEDLELRRDDRARTVVVVDERVDQLTALAAADRLLVTDRPGRRPRAVQPGP